jgi:hypothetical protein
MSVQDYGCSYLKGIMCERHQAELLGAALSPAAAQEPWQFTREEFESWAAVVAGAPSHVDMPKVEAMLREAARHAPKGG